MSESTKQLVREWLSHHHGDIEACARWMRDSVRIGGLRDCRALIAEAVK